MNSQENTASDPELSAPQLKKLMAAIFQDHLVMEAAAASITNQPRVDLALVPTLPDNQALAAGNAQDYQNQLSTHQVAIYTEIQGFNTVFQRFAAALLPSAQAWDAGDPQGAQRFTKIIEVVKRYATGFKTSAQDRQSALDGHVLLVKQDVERYQTDVDLVSTKIRGSGGEVDQLSAKLSDLSDQLADANRRIANGAVKDLLKAAELGLSLGMEVAEVPGVASVVIDTAFSFADDAVGDDHDAQEASQQALKEYRATLIRLANETAQFGALDTLMLNIGRFSRSLADAAATNASLAKAWDTFAQAIDTFCTYQHSPAPGYFVAQLQAAQQFWQALSDEAAVYENKTFAIHMEASNGH